jgi:hypothetical protein
MHKPPLALLIAACWFSCANGASPDSLESRVAAQNTLFEDYYQAELQAHPQRATAYGDYRYNDQLEQVSLAAQKAQHARDQSYLDRLGALSSSGFSETGLALA